MRTPTPKSRWKPSLSSFFVFLPASIVVLALDLACGAPSDHQGETAMVACQSVVLSQPPAWGHSGVWDAEGRLILTDTGGRALHRYLLSGRRIGPNFAPFSEDLARFPPSIIQLASGQRFVLELRDNRLVTVDQAFNILGTRDLTWESDQGDVWSLTLFGWTVAGNDILGFGDVMLERVSAWKRGIFRFSLSVGGGFQILREIPPNQLQDYQMLGMPFQTSLNETGYVLFIEQGTVIYKHVPGMKELQPLPAFPRRLQLKLPTLTEKYDFASVARAVESSTMPVGIWGWEDHLYILWRAPKENGIPWKLIKLDPRTGQVIGSTKLPTAAPHLTVVPGQTWWAFVEKGRVFGFGLQNTDRVLLVPSQALRGNLDVRLAIEDSNPR